MALRRPQSIEKIDAPRNNEHVKISWAGYVVSYLQTNKERGVERRFGKGLCVNNNCTGGQQACTDEDSTVNGLERAQEFEKSFLFGGLELFESVGDVLGFATMAKDGVEQGDGSAVVHETRMQANAPERGGANFVCGIAIFGDGEISPVGLVHLLAVVL